MVCVELWCELWCESRSISTGSGGSVRAIFCGGLVEIEWWTWSDFSEKRDMRD